MATARVLAPARAWSRFWFAPIRSASYVVWRTALGLAVGCWLLSLAPDLVDLYGESGIAPNPVYRDYRWSLFRWFTSDRTVHLVWLAAAVSVVLTLAGRWVKPAAIVLFVCVVSFTSDNTDLNNSGDELLRIWCAYHAVFALLTPNRLLSVPLRCRDDPHERPADWPWMPGWFIRLAQIQLTVIYVFSVIAKFRGQTWLDGTASLLALELVDFQRFPVPRFLIESLAFGAILTWGTLAMEMSLPFLLWTRRTRRFAVIVGVGLHVSFDYALRVGFFGWAMVVGYASFLTPGEAATILRWITHPRAAFTGWRRRSGALRGGEEPGEEEPGADDERDGEPGHLVDDRVEQPAG